jgi:LysM repeat protein
MSGAPAFVTCSGIVSGSAASTGGCVTNGERYLQYQLQLTTSDGLDTPTFQDISVDYTVSVPTPTPTPTLIQSNSTNQNNTISNPSSSAPTCGDTSPTGTPDLFQIDTTTDQATLYFAPISSSTTYYFISYGLTPGDERYGIMIPQGPSSGVLSYTLNYLSANTTYYIRMRGGNGCMPGKWGNEMKMKTPKKGAVRYYKNFLSILLSIFNPKPTQIKPIKAVASDSGSLCEYTVKSGDTLWNIALKKNGSGDNYTEIIHINNLVSTVLLVGQKLKIKC